MCGQTLVAGRQLQKEIKHRVRQQRGKIIATELGSIMLEQVAMFPDPSTNNRPGNEAIDHAPHDMDND